MKQPAVVGLVLASLFLSTSASADPLKCHTAVARNINKYQATLAKNVAGCHKSRNSRPSMAATRCNDAVQADLKGKRAGARQKTIDLILKSCVADGADDGNDETAVRANYSACPSPVSASDDGGATTSIDTFTELANCLMDVSEHYIEVVGDELLGNPATLPASKAVATCQSSNASVFANLVKVAGTERTKCHMALEKSMGGLQPYPFTNCAVNDPNYKILAAVTAFDMGMLCSPVQLGSRPNWVDFGICAARSADPTYEEFGLCGVGEAAWPITNGIVGAAIELPAASCPQVVDILVNSGQRRKATDTSIDLGWAGSAHGIDGVDRWKTAVTVDNCNDDCTDCELSLNAHQGDCRCDYDPVVFCSTAGGPDPACGGGNCTCTLGPPVPLVVSSVPLCVENRLTRDLSGSMAQVGEFDIEASVRSIVHSGESMSQPCPICVGDVYPDNRALQGYCSGGPRSGQACDMDGRDPIFGAVSRDCPPSPASNISGAGVLADFVLTTGTSSLAAAIPAAGTYCDGASDCHCSVCSGDSSIGCSNDTPCIAAGAGTCGATLPAGNPQQNACTTTCSDDGNGNGVCDGPQDSFCSGYLRADGHGAIHCSTNGDCDIYDCNDDRTVTPGECGACDLLEPRACFLPTISATGTPGPLHGAMVSTLCLGQSGDPAVDAAIGLPGPARFELDVNFDLVCADGLTEYDLPGGPRCALLP